MKNIKIHYNKRLTIILLLMVSLIPSVLFQSCKDDSDDGGTPSVQYIRMTDPEKSDSLLARAFMGSVIAIIGENLQDVAQVWFNDQEAMLNTSYITANSIIVTVPNEIPTVVTNAIILITRSGEKTTYPFGVDVPAPLLTSMTCEYVADGDTAFIQGNFFIDDPSSPLQVTFPGNLAGTVISVSLKEISVTVPAGTGVGPIAVKSIYGASRSSFYFRDDRINVLDYDGLTTSGSWRGGTILNDANSLDGNYLMLKGILDDNQGAEDYSGGGFVSELWGDANGRPEGNFFSGDVKDYSLKFEANVKVWTGAYLNICFGPWNANVSGVQNQIYWDNLNARGLWRPWEDAGATSFKTDGWITVVIPMSDIKYNKDFGEMEFDPSVAGSMTLWIKGPSAVTGEKSEVEIYIDNVRIVKN